MKIKRKYQILLLFVVMICFPASLSAKDDGWKLQATNLENEYVGAPVANGRIGILPWKEPFSIRHVVLNHVFDADAHNGISQVLYGINPFNVEMQIDGKTVSTSNISDWRQEIDMKAASHNTYFTAMDKAKVGYNVYALRNLQYCGLITIEVEALDNITLRFINTIDIPDVYSESDFNVQRVNGENSRSQIFRKSALSKHRGRAVSASSAYLYDPKDKLYNVTAEGEDNVMSIILKKGQKVEFALAGAVCSDREFLDPYNESDRQITFAAEETVPKLIEGHKNLWNKLWEGDIIIDGDDEAQKAVRFALFNLYSYVREATALSIPPMGLSDTGCYNGHVFWDAEIWMYPPLLYLNQDIARSMIEYRVKRLDGARHKALSYGYSGAMFPWESDDLGEEACPVWALTGPFEHHITADIAIAAWNYYCVTGDDEWLKTKGYPLIKDIADFWVSRSVRNDDGSYSIKNVVCADEYAGGVDDNAFTNGAVIKALQAAVKASAICGMNNPGEWKEISEKLIIPKFKNGVTREHATYNGEKIKQADVNLLGYPLGLVSDPESQRKDMEYYVERIDTVNGPAMSYSVFATQYSRLGDADKAYEMFERSYKPNSRPPYGVFAETPTSDNPYFATGAGGFLQAVISGFCGLEITDKGIVQVPSTLPKHWKKVTITGVGPEKKTFERKR